MELRRAIDQISEIHAQVLRSEVFSGYRAVPVAVTGGLAAVTAALQALWFDSSALSEVLVLWLSYAACCAVISAIDVFLHNSGRAPAVRRQALRVVGQFVPSVLVGATATWIIWPLDSAAHLLPGLWTLLFGLGILASLPYLTRRLAWAGGFYLVAGALLLSSAAPGTAPSPWALGAVFCAGQAAVAQVLHLAEAQD